MTLQDLGAPTWTSALLDRIRTKGPGRATAGDWLRFVLACNEHGIGKDEIKYSGLAHALVKRYAEHEVLARRQVLDAVVLKPAMPTMQLAVDESFRPSGEWAECAVRLEPSQYVKRGLLGKWPASWYVKRYQHRSLGWSVVLARHTDLRHSERKWWLLLDQKGKRVADQPAYGFTSHHAALAHASMLMQRLFSKSARARHTPNWERFSLHGLGPYAELLITLPQWPGNFYSPVHFPGVRNLLIHLRTNVCDADGGRRVLFLDEVQSDWLATATKQDEVADTACGDATIDVPFSRDWPLLALKFALWWAWRQGYSGVAWSTADLHLNRWREYGPPIEIYRRGLPDAAAKLARVLSLELSQVHLLRRRVQPDLKDEHKWQVTSQSGSPACSGFVSRDQADRFADLTGAVDHQDAPVLWLRSDCRLDRVPLFGVAEAALWRSDQPASSEPKSVGTVTSIPGGAR